MIEEFLKMFPNCPNPEHEPKKFAHYVKMFRYFTIIDVNSKKGK